VVPKQAALLWPAALGSLSLRRSPCVREHCRSLSLGRTACQSCPLRAHQRRRFAIYIPDELVPEVQLSLDNGRVLQELLYQSALRYTKALKHQKARTIQKVKK